MLNTKKWPTVVRYCVVGGLAYALELCVLIGIHNGLGLQRTVATAIAFWVGLIVAFVLQKLFAFRDYRKEVSAIGRQGFFYGLLVIFNYMFTLFVVSIFPDRYLLLSRTLALIITTIWNFFVYKRFIFDASKADDSQKRERQNEISNSLKSSNNVLAIAAILLLIVCTVYGAWQSSYTTANSSDALSDTYLVGDGLGAAHINFQPEHTSLIKLPILWVQSRFTYNFASFVSLNIILALASVLGWTYIICRIFGRKYLIPTALTLSALTLGSVVFNTQFAWSTVRNIEFPLALAYIAWMVSFRDRSKHLIRRELLSLGVVACLFGLLLASDLYFFYIVALPLFLYMIISLVKKPVKIRSVLAIAAILVSYIFSKLLLLLLQAIGFISLHPSGLLAKSVPLSLLRQSIKEDFKQFRELTGANIFHQAFGWQTVEQLINLFVIVIGSLAGLFIIYRLLSAKLYKSENKRNVEGIAASVALVFFTAFLAYGLSDQVIQQTLGGGIAVIGQGRYITLMVFIVALLFEYALIEFLPSRFYKVACVLLLISILAGAISVHKSYAITNLNAARQKDIYVQIDRVLDNNGVHEVLTGHWYGASSRFWSVNSTRYAPVTGCNYPFVELSRLSWYTQGSYKKTALVVDHSGSDASFWDGCNDRLLTQIYGQPVKKIRISHGPTLWIYNYDVRKKLILDS